MIPHTRSMALSGATQCGRNPALGALAGQARVALTMTALVTLWMERCAGSSIRAGVLAADRLLRACVVVMVLVRFRPASTTAFRLCARRDIICRC